MFSKWFKAIFFLSLCLVRYNWGIRNQRDLPTFYRNKILDIENLGWEKNTLFSGSFNLYESATGS